MSQTFPNYVFISYSRSDETTMRRIVDFVRDRGIIAWVDNENLIPGTPIWEEEIEKAIMSAGAVVVLLSPDSKSSPWVRREISYAEDHAKRIFPILIAGNEKSSIPIRLTIHQRIDVRQNEEKGLISLSTSLSNYLGELARHESERQAREEAKRLVLLRTEEELIVAEKREADRLPQQDKVILPEHEASQVSLEAATQTEEPIASQVNFFTPAEPLLPLVLSASQKITLYNANNIVQIACWGIGSVSQVVYTPNGEEFVVGTSLGIFFYDTKTFKLTKHIKSDSWVVNLALSPDGQTLASAQRRTIHLWRVRDGILLKTLKGPAEEVQSVAFSPDGNLLASGSSNNIIRLWRVKDGSLLKTVKAPNPVYRVAFLSDEALVSFSTYRTICDSWNIRDEKWLEPMQGPSEWDQGVDFLSEGQILSTYSIWDHAIRLWRVSDGKRLQTFRGQRDIKSTALSPDGQLLASGSGEKTICLWRVSDGTMLKTIKGHTADVQSLAFSPDGVTLVSGSQDNTIRFWRHRDGASLKILKEHTGEASNIIFSPDGLTIASTSEDYTICLRQVSDGSLSRTLKGHTDFISCIAFSPDGSVLASGSYDGTIRIWHVNNGTLLKTLEEQTGRVECIAFSPDGSIIASGARYTIIHLWHVGDGKKVKTLRGHKGLVTSIMFSPDGNLLATGSGDKRVRLWHTIDGKLLKTIQGPTDWITSLAFSPNGSIIASSYHNTICLWNVSNRKLLKTLHGHAGRVNKITFSNDGEILASASNDNTIRIWHVKNGALLKTLEGHTRGVKTVAISPANILLVSGSIDGTIRWWGLSPAERNV